MIQLIEVEIKNFFSVGNAPITVKFDDYQRAIIIGKNGASKSAVFLESLCYALYGKSFRNLKKGQVVNAINKKKCLVTLTFIKDNVLYKVSRGQKPNIFEIYKDDILIPQSASVVEYQESLELIIGIEMNTFKQLVCIGMAGYLPFMQLPSGKRSAMIEDLIGTDIFSIMNDLNKIELQRLKSEKITNSMQLTNNQEQLNIHDNYKKNNDNNINNQVNDLLSKNEAIKNEIISNKKLLDEKREVLLNMDSVDHDLICDLQDKINNATNDIIVKRNDGKHIKDKYNLISSNDECPTCTQPIDKEFSNNCMHELKTQAVELKSDIQNNNDVINKYKAELNLLQHKVNERKQLVHEFNSLGDITRQLISDINNNNNFIEKLKEPTQDNSEEINRLNKVLEEQKKVLYNINNESDDRAIIKKIISDSGIKKFIIAQYIPLLNGYINKYLDALGANYVFILDSEFNETIKSRGRDTFTYESFSQGERARIDLSIILSFRKLVESRSNNASIMNILVFDELLDSSLDSDGSDYVNALLELIGNESNNKIKLFVISHNTSNINNEIWTDCITLEKKGNFSYLTSKKV